MGAMKTGIGLAAAALLAGCASYASAGTYGGGFGPPGGYGPGGYDRGYAGGQSLRCESERNRSRHCAADTRGGVPLVRQLSRTQRVSESWRTSSTPRPTGTLQRR